MSVAISKMFDGVADFEALNAAHAFLTNHGFSYGIEQRGAPAGILYGDYAIQKWRNLRREERRALHGIIRAGDNRRGPVFVDIYGNSPNLSPQAQP